LNKPVDAVWPMMMRLTAAAEAHEVHVFEDDEGAGKPIDPDPIVSTVGAN
jgi:hypothetical protein